MRILNISFKNINSLEGEGRVAFDQGPIADSGVFAITGPNGSGKTSILDVITLGLYGETFRFDKPAEHVMTQETHECFAQVEFALGNDKFRSSWAVNQAEAAVATFPQMRLQRIGDVEEVLAETPNQVRNRIAELTGMDFHRFSKSIVLPQGDFAAFLHALDSERMDILEKISGTELYADYRQQAEQQFTQTQTRLKQLQQDIVSVPLLDQASLDAAAQDLEDFKAQVEDFLTQREEAQQRLTSVQAIASLEKQQQQLRLKRQDLIETIARYQVDLDNVAKGQDALRFRGEINLLDSKQAEIEQRQDTLEQYRQELALLQRQLGDSDEAFLSLPETSLSEQKQVVDTLKLSVSDLKLELPRQRELAASIQQQLSDNRRALDDINQWLAAHQPDASLIDDFPDVVRLRNLRSELLELGGKQKANANWSKNTSAALKKNKAALETTQADITDLKQQIVNNLQTLEDISLGKSLDELKGLHQEQRIRVSDLQEMYSLANATSKLTHKSWLSWLGIKKKTDVPPDEAELQRQFDELSQALSREQNIIKVLEQALRNEALIKKMKNERAKLIEGQPCHLCGSIAHPFVQKPPVFSDAKKAMQDQRSKIQALKARVDQTAAQLKAAQKYDSQMSARQRRLQQMLSEWTLLANRLSVMRDGMEIGNLSLQKALLTEETEELNKLTSLIKEYADLQRSTSKMTAEQEQKQASITTLTQTVADLEAQWANRPPEFDDVEKRFAERMAEEKLLLEKLEQQLGALGEKLPGKGKENALFDRLNSRRQDYQVYLLRQEGLQKENAALTDKLKTCENKLDYCQQQLAQDLENLNQQERLSLHIAIIEKQKLIADQDQQLRISQIEYKTISQVLTDKISSAFESIEALTSLIHLSDQKNAIEQQFETERNSLEQLERQLQELTVKLDQKMAAATNYGAIDDIQRELSTIDNQLDIAKQEIHTLENKLAKQAQYREKWQALQAQIDEQQRLFIESAAEMKLINDDPAGFRRRVQSLMADKLLSHTNQILEKLSGRYYVRSGASELGLALEIEDTKQKSARRLPQTLSGGESFVVSLALALALAEIANNGKAIDSLFLDEGFGNLDADSLYLAMSTLESLKTHGKTVGVISHVEGVKKRIKTQIELVKKPNGLSELKMVA